MAALKPEVLRIHLWAAGFSHPTAYTNFAAKSYRDCALECCFTLVLAYPSDLRYKALRPYI
jgi:hypothetical protein